MTKSFENFRLIIALLQEQHDKDLEFVKDATHAFKTEFNPYDNSLLANHIIQELASWFEDEKLALQEINRFMYELDFGRLSEGIKEPVTELWEILECGYDTVNFKSIEFTPTKKESYDSAIKTSDFINDEAGHWPNPDLEKYWNTVKGLGFEKTPKSIESRMEDDMQDKANLRYKGVSKVATRLDLKKE